MANPIRSYQDLDVWQLGMELAEASYRLTQEFPRSEQFGLTSQIRRAAASVPANIAEGYGRDSTGGFIQALRVSQGSLKELETHFLLAARVGICGFEDVKPQIERCERTGKLIRSLIRSLQAKREKRQVSGEA